MAFNTNGFLGTQINTVISDITNEFSEWFAICEEINTYSYKIRERLDIKSLDIRNIIIGCLYLKIHHAFQSSVILSKYGMNSEAKIITRTALESLFYLSATVNQPDFYKVFVDADSVSRSKFFTKIKKVPDIINAVQDNLLLDALEGLKERNKDNKLNELKLSEVAEKALMIDDYNSLYSILCNDVHPNIRNLESRYLLIENDEIKAFNCTPSTIDIKLILYTTCCTLIKTLACLDDNYNLNIKSNLELFSQRLIKIYKSES